MGDHAYGQRIRVGGDVENGSIQRAGSQVQFVLVQDKLKLKVAYTGTDPLPDTFRDGAQALADGKLDKDGVFRAAKIQAKCASKYEAKPGQLPPGELRPISITASAASRGEYGKSGFVAILLAFSWLYMPRWLPSSAAVAANPSGG